MNDHRALHRPAGAPAPQRTEATATVLIAYKGFDANLRCRDFQYAIGESYEHTDKVEVCSAGFHACEYPLDVFTYYPPATSRFGVVEQSGTLALHNGDSKVASSRIKVAAEIGIARLVKAAIEYTMKRCHPIDPASPASSTGERGAASNTGDQGAASSTGYQGAASSTGEHGAALASGCGRVMGTDGNALFLVERNDSYEIVAAWAGIVGRDGIKADTWYVLRNGQPVEVAL